VEPVRGEADGPKNNPDAAARYWDANREKSLDPAFWMAHPLCRRAINRRVSGSEHEWPLDWFRRITMPKVFARGLSWGCGLGAFERAAVRSGLVKEIEAFDVSAASLGDARNEAIREGISGIHYGIGDFNDPRLSPRRYDIVFFHASLHHVAALERLFRRLVLALKPGAAIYVDEYVGPSRFHWSPLKLKLAQAVLGMMPFEARCDRTSLRPSRSTTPRSRSGPTRSRDSSGTSSGSSSGGPTAARSRTS
jgi:SAM-dependent methyltransferase